MLIKKLKNRLKKTLPKQAYEQAMLSYDFLKNKSYTSAIAVLLKDLTEYQNKIDNKIDMITLIANNFDNEDLYLWNKKVIEVGEEDDSFLKIRFADVVTDIIWTVNGLYPEDEDSIFSEELVNDVLCITTASYLKLNRVPRKELEDKHHKFLKDIKWRPINCVDTYFEAVYELCKQLKGDKN